MTLNSIAEQIGAMDELIGLAQRRIRVFDHDLSQMGWNSAERMSRLGLFLRGTRGRRLDIIVHDTTWLEASCPRLIGLLRTYSYAVTIYRTGPEARHAADPLLIQLETRPRYNLTSRASAAQMQGCGFFMDSTACRFSRLGCRFRASRTTSSIFSQTWSVRFQTVKTENIMLAANSDL